jgi:hypothetical protein
LQGETTLFEADENVAAKNIKFKVDVPSVLRTASYLTTTDAIENDISFRLSKGYAPVASGDGNLYYTELQPGNDYNLAVMRSEAAPAGDLAQHFELAVEPVAYLDSYVEKKALPLSRCQPFGDGTPPTHDTHDTPHNGGFFIITHLFLQCAIRFLQHLGRQAVHLPEEPHDQLARGRPEQAAG